tara:strand:+ start:76 stop:219 length:144 start_codon:yes stop_codon:yes gene_type:complete
VAVVLGITYEEINVWFFIIILPIVSGTSLGHNFYFIHKISSNRAVYE